MQAGWLGERHGITRNHWRGGIDSGSGRGSGRGYKARVSDMHRRLEASQQCRSWAYIYKIIYNAAAKRLLALLPDGDRGQPWTRDSRQCLISLRASACDSVPLCSSTLAVLPASIPVEISRAPSAPNPLRFQPAIRVSAYCTIVTFAVNLLRSPTNPINTCAPAHSGTSQESSEELGLASLPSPARRSWGLEELGPRERAIRSSKPLLLECSRGPQITTMRQYTITIPRIANTPRPARCRQHSPLHAASTI